MEHTSYIELSKSALTTNIQFIRKILGDTTLSSVVKGNAYGHGIGSFCPMVYENGIRHFSVFGADEAYKLLSSVPKDITVMIMGQIENHQIEWAIENNVEFFVFEEDRLNKAIEVAKKLKIPARIHIEIETGMNRTGFDTKQLKTLFHRLENQRENIQVQGVCSHLAGAESISNYKRIKDQQAKFQRAQKLVKSLGWTDLNYHLACSAASIQYPKTQLDLARIGILQYGFFPNNEVLVQYLTKNKTVENPLKRVISWKTTVMAKKEVKAGEFIGYGTSFFSSEKTTVALIPVGYSDGFSRSLSNHGKVLIRGERFDVIGIVNMNMIAVDITSNPKIEKGEEVVLIGNQGDAEITVSSFSDFSALVNYELLTRLPANITRKIVE